MIRRWGCLLLFALLLAGCGNWARTGGRFLSEGYAVDLPRQWFRLRNVNYLLMTRDGTALQSLTISRLPANVRLPHTKRTLAEDMLQLEVAEAVLDDLAFDENKGHLTVCSSDPAFVGGEPGFRLELTYRDRKDLQYRMVAYGVLSGNWFYALQYEAPERYYFSRDAADFERIVGSFSFR